MPATLNFTPVEPPVGEWLTLPIGCGGLATGMHIADDGSMVCRTDVGGIYRWTGTCDDYDDPTKVWEQLITYDSLGSFGPNIALGDNMGGYELVQAPGDSDVLVAIFPDVNGVAQKYWIWYSLNAGVTWLRSNIAMTGTQNAYAPATGCGAGANLPGKLGYYKIAVDPANPAVAYAGMPVVSGQTAGAFTSLNKAGGSTLATWTSVKTTGSTPVPACSFWLSAGIAFDRSSGTSVLFSGQTVTNRVIVPIGGAGIYESTNGGSTFTEIAAGPMGTTSFFVGHGGFTAEGVYYCLVCDNATVGGVWRYKAGTWTNITTGTYAPYQFANGWSLIIDPRDNPTSKAYLSVQGLNGIGTGYTSTNANTAASPNWIGSTSGQYSYLKAKPYDIGYINTLFGQQHQGAFTYATAVAFDPAGRLWWPGNQSVFYFGTSATDDTPLTVPPSYVGAPSAYQLTGNTTGTSTSITLSGSAAIGATISNRGIPPGTTIVSGPVGSAGVYVMSQAGTVSSDVCVINGLLMYSWSVGRGMEVTVSQDVLCPPGGDYPIVAVQDLGAPMRGTLTTYPTEMYWQFHEYTNEGLEYAANDPSFVVARVTGQQGSYADVSGYSTDYGADGSWTDLPNTPTSLWQAEVIGTISNGAGAAGQILNVTSVTSGRIFEFSLVALTYGGDTYARVQKFGTDGTTGTGGTGTYKIAGAGLVASTTIYCSTPIQGGQTVAVDADHWITVPAGLNTIGWGQWVVPAYTTNATGACTWALCSGLPAAGWILRPWVFGPTAKPFAVGYGTDFGTVWACDLGGQVGDGTARLYRSTDSGATFSLIASWACSVNCEGAYCLSMPSRPNELWISGSFTSDGGLWHVTNARTGTTAVTPVNMPVGHEVPKLFTLGAPATEGGYPTLYMRSRAVGDPDAPFYLFEGQYPGTGTTVTWTLFGPTGTQQDLPKSCQLVGFQSISGDWNTYRRLYCSSGAAGSAYYNP